MLYQRSESELAVDELLNAKKGRKLIIVDAEITPYTILDTIEKAWTTFETNQIQINKLIDYYLGKQNQDSRLP